MGLISPRPEPRAGARCLNFSASSTTRSHKPGGIYDVARCCCQVLCRVPTALRLGLVMLLFSFLLVPPHLICKAYFRGTCRRSIMRCLRFDMIPSPKSAGRRATAVSWLGVKIQLLVRPAGRGDKPHLLHWVDSSSNECCPLPRCLFWTFQPVRAHRQASCHALPSQGC